MQLKLGLDLSLNIFLWHISVKLKLVLNLSLNVCLWHIYKGNIYMKLNLCRNDYDCTSINNNSCFFTSYIVAQ